MRSGGEFSRDVVTKVILPRFLLIFSRDKVVTSHGLVVTFSHRPKTYGVEFEDLRPNAQGVDLVVTS